MTGRVIDWHTALVLAVALTILVGLAVLTWWQALTG